MNSSDLTDRKLVDEWAGGLATIVQGRIFAFEPLAKHTSLKVGGPASLYVYPRSFRDLTALFEWCRDKGLRPFTIGYGTNLLVSDDGFEGCVIDLADCCRRIDWEGEILKAGAGVWGSDVVKFAASAGRSGFEKMAGIPGGIGGWAIMNAGAFGSSFSDHLISVKVMNSSGGISTLTKDEVGFEYRATPGLAGLTVLEARFHLPHSSAEEVMREVEATITERYRRNVMTLPSAGSVFKNPPGMFAAKLIDECGCKGMTEGGVEVSPLHANFIVNARGGTATDIVRLIGRVRTVVKEKHGVDLRLELQTVGFATPLF